MFIAFTEASCKFLKEVHAGDTLYSALEIVAGLDHSAARRWEGMKAGNVTNHEFAEAK